jgi:outer membrane protein assembly factor BamB
MDQSQLRASEMVVGPDGKLYLALQTGMGGAGALAVHDPDTGKTVLHHPVAEEQVNGVILTDKKAIWGTCATKLFQWDCPKGAAGTLISAPDGARLAGLAWCGNGKIYAISSGTPALYAFDLEQGNAVNTAPIPWGQPPIYRRVLAAGPDGLVYGFVTDEKKNSTLYVVDPHTHQPCKLGVYPELSTGWAFVGNDIYLGSGAHVVRFSKSF